MADAKPWSRGRASLYALIARNPKSNRNVVDLCELEPSDAFLDIGCGPGAAVRAAGARAGRSVGVDNSDPILQIARRRSTAQTNVEFANGSAEAIPFGDGEFTHVVTIHAFHHWSDQDAGVSEVLRVLRPGGRLLIAETRSNGKHGISRERAAALAERVIELGFRNANVIEVGRELVVDAVA